MKIKKFFIENKEKILNLLKLLLSIVVLFLYSYTLFACGFCTREILETSDKISLKSKKERIDSSSITYINLLTDDVIDSDVHAYYNANGSLVNSTVLTLTNRFVVSPSVSYVYGNITGQVAYVTFFDVNENFISSSTKTGLITSPSNAYYCALSVFNARLNDSFFYEGQIVYNYYLPPIQNIVDDEYNEGYENGLYDSTNNLFQSQYCKLLIKQGYLYETYGESDSTLGNGYFNKDLFFKGNHLDFTYLYEALRVDGLFQIALDFMINFDANTRFYLSNLNLKVVPSSASPITPVESLNLNVRTEGQLGESNELIQFLEYDKLYRYDNRNLINSIFFNNSWPDCEVYLYNVMTYEVDSYNKGFDSGYDKGYSIGYSEGETYQDYYYNDLIIPAIKLEYEQLGYDQGYLQGKNDTLNDGSGVALFDAFTLIGKGFEAWNPILNMQVIPGFTLGVFIAIPIIIAVVFVVIKLLQR